MKHRIVLPLFFALTGSAIAQLPQYHAQVFGSEQGIGGGGISDIFKDRQQFLWVVNATTIQRFDGRNVRSYAFEKIIYQSICSRDNRVWALSGRKVWRMEPMTDRFVEMPFDTSGGIVPAAVFQLNNYPVCVLSNKGIYAWQEAQNRFERLPLHPPVPRGYTNLWRFDTCASTIFYPGNDSLYAYDLASDRQRALPVAGEIPYLHALTPDLVALSLYNSHTYWYDFRQGKISLIDVKQYGITRQRSIFGITGVAPLGNGQYLMTSRIGTYHYDLRNNRFSKERIYAAGKPLELEDMLVRIFLDENGVAWAHNTNNIVAFENLQNGLGLLRNHHYEAPRAWNNRIAGFTEDADGNIWFCGGGGFNKLDLKTGQVTPFPAQEGATDRLSHNSVRGIGFDGRYIILGPTDKGVWLFEPRSERFRRPVYASDSVRRAVESDFIDHLRVLRNGDIVVAGRFHPYRIQAGSYRMDFIAFPGDRSNTNVAFQDKQGHVWIGTHSGAFCLDEKYRLLSTHPMETVLCMQQETDSALLIGTSLGLRRLQYLQDSARVVNVAAPFEGTTVTFLFRDQRLRWWIGTTNGLYLADATLAVFKQFDFADNIQAQVFNGNACLRAGNGMAFFSGINGINYLFPEKISMEDRLLSVSIQSLRIHDRDSIQGIAPGQRLVFPFRDNTLTFEVVAPYYNNAGKLQYRYRLPGFSEQWVSLSGGNQIRLAGLPKGDYRLEVAASITGKVWYPAHDFVAFTILPPFWQTWSFRLAMLALLAALVWGLIRFRENRLKKQQANQLELEKLKNTTLEYQLALAQTEEERRQALLEAVDNQRKAAEAKLQSMRLQMNPHFLFNALNSIQQMTMSGKGDKAALYLSKFSKLLRKVLTHSDHEEVNLQEEIDMLQLYLELESLRFDDSFKYEIVCEPGLDKEEYRVPTLLIQPFVENAIWHGLLHKEGKRNLHISFKTTSDEGLECIVEDNGIGRSAAQSQRSSSHTGKGLRTGEERLHILNQRNKQQNTLKIIDLYSSEGHAAGTRVCLRLR